MWPAAAVRGMHKPALRELQLGTRRRDRSPPHALGDLWLRGFEHLLVAGAAGVVRAPVVPGLDLDVQERRCAPGGVHSLNNAVEARDDVGGAHAGADGHKHWQLGVLVVQGRDVGYEGHISVNERVLPRGAVVVVVAEVVGAAGGKETRR